MEPTLVIMAAGLGSRFGGTKQLASVGPHGEAIFDYTIHDAIRAGFGNVVVIVRSDIEEEVRSHLLAQHGPNFQPILVCQDLDSLAPSRTKPWGTGHAILCTRNVLNEPFAVVNADDFYGAEAFKTLASALQTDATEEASQEAPDRYQLVVYRLDRTLSERGTVSRGVCVVSERGELKSITEHLAIERDARGTITAAGVPLPADSPVSMNLWGLRPGLLKALERDFSRFVSDHAADSKAEFLLPEVIGAMVLRGDVVVDVRPTSATWLGITYPGDIDDARQQVAMMIAGGDYPSPLR